MYICMYLSTHSHTRNITYVRACMHAYVHDNDTRMKIIKIRLYEHYCNASYIKNSVYHCT